MLHEIHVQPLLSCHFHKFGNKCLTCSMLLLTGVRSETCSPVVPKMSNKWINKPFRLNVSIQIFILWVSKVSKRRVILCKLDIYLRCIHLIQQPFFPLPYSILIVAVDQCLSYIFYHIFL